MFNVGDIVRIGKGKVEYTVEASYPGDVFKVRGGKSNRAQDVEASRLVLVKSFEAPVENERLEGVERLATWELELYGTTEKPYVLEIDGKGVEYKSFDAAAFALSRHTVRSYAAIYKGGKRLVERAA